MFGRYFTINNGGVLLDFDTLALQAGRFVHTDLVDTPYSLFVSSIPLPALLVEASLRLGPFLYQSRWIRLTRNSREGWPDRGANYKVFAFQAGDFRFGLQDSAVYFDRVFDEEYFLSPVPHIITQIVTKGRGKPWSEAANDNSIMGLFVEWQRPRSYAYAQWLVDDISLDFLVPGFLRDKLGRLGALATSLMLAFSPALVYFSRTLDGSIVAAASALALLVAVNGYVAHKRSGYVIMGAVALAFGVMSALSFYTVALAGLVFALYVAWETARDPEMVASPKAAWVALLADKAMLRKAGLIVAGMVALVSSALLFNMGGWQATLNVLGRWFGQFGRAREVVSWHGQGAVSWRYYLQLLAVYETLPLIAGLAGLVLAIKGRDWMPRLWVAWALVGLVVHSIAGQRAPGNVLIILLPLILLGALALERLGAWVREAEIDSYSWLFPAVAGILFAYLYLQMVGFTFGGDSRYQVLAIVASVGLVACFAVFWYWVGTSQALPVGAITLLLLGLVFQVHTLMGLNYYTARDARELVNQSPTSPDILNMAPFLEAMSSRHALDRHVLPLLIDERLKPVVAWYARSFYRASFAYGMPGAPDERILVVLDDSQEGPAQYMGQRFRLVGHPQVAGLGWGDWAKWYLRRFEIGSIDYTKVVVWVKR